MKWSGTLRGMSETQRLEVDVDGLTSRYLERRRCAGRQDVATAAGHALHDLALADEAARLAAWSSRHDAELLASIEDAEAALAEAG